MFEQVPGKSAPNDPYKRNPWRKPGIPPIMWVILLVVIIGSSLFSVPRIIRTYHSSGLASIVSEYRETRQRSETAALYEPALITLIARDPAVPEIGLSPVSIPIELPVNSGIDEIMEYLVSGPSWEELSRGYISLIPQETQYFGSSVTRGIAYIDISDDLLNQPILGTAGVRMALEQIIMSAKNIDTVEHVGILIDHEFMGFDDDLEGIIQRSLL